MSKITNTSAGGHVVAVAVTLDRGTTTATAIACLLIGGFTASLAPQSEDTPTHLVLRFILFCMLLGAFAYFYQRGVNNQSDNLSGREFEALTREVAGKTGELLSSTQISQNSNEADTGRSGSTALGENSNLPVHISQIDRYYRTKRTLGILLIGLSAFGLGAISVDTYLVVEQVEVQARNEERERSERIDGLLADLEYIAEATRKILDENSDDLRIISQGGRRLLEDPHLPLILKNLDRLTDGVAQKTPPLLDRTERLISRIEKGMGMLEESYTDDARSLLRNLRRISDDMRPMLRDMRPMLRDFARFAHRAANLDEKALRKFLQQEGLRFRLIWDRRSRARLNELEE